MQGLGYKEIIEYLEGNRTLDEAIEIIKRYQALRKGRLPGLSRKGRYLDRQGQLFK